MQELQLLEQWRLAGLVLMVRALALVLVLACGRRRVGVWVLGRGVLRRRAGPCPPVNRW